MKWEGLDFAMTFYHAYRPANLTAYRLMKFGLCL